MMCVICVTIYTVAHSCTFFTDTQVTNHVPINFFLFLSTDGISRGIFCATANTNHKEITLIEYCLLLKSVLKLHSIF